MNRLFASILLVPLLLYSTILAAEDSKVGSFAPAFELQRDATSTFSLSSLRGKVVYLDFWASWCPPCMVSLPWMNDLHKKFPADHFQIVAINVDEQDKEAERVIKKLKPEFMILRDPKGAIPSLYRIATMPTSFIIRKDGTIAKIHSGFRSSDKEEIEKEIAQLIKEH